MPFHPIVFIQSAFLSLMKLNCVKLVGNSKVILNFISWNVN